uniref:Ketosteroid isomerase-related protein n=1 Tax=Candidatus Kentrum sp. FM TaxID=2126340 RepID=A0A450S2I6_9GAMM|nr:MAG: Ketosteroid isomerase-related protein [Candidatus Kentron sp. FM]VFJ49126.1 MAG: Ketosteroid isomerase-related protein [Candidatus Kentron sp. FM]VFK08366.1 MAG: Ketosteroid isomerase-related protein [Candidatus Kentron sp. FM]
MLFYVQMKWNYQGRLSQDELWALEEKEAEHGLEGIRSGFVQLFKVVSQHRIIAIVEADSLENLDRNSMGWLPMREYLEFEVVWALRDYKGFAEDVRNRFPRLEQQPPKPTYSNRSTREVAEDWFESLRRKDFERAITLLDDNIIWENLPFTPGVTDVPPWLGTYNGLEEVQKSFEIMVQHTEVIAFTPYNLIVDGDQAVGMLHEHARCIANGNEYDLYVATHLKIRNGKIVNWRVYWDPSPLIVAYKNL